GCGRTMQATRWPACPTRGAPDFVCCLTGRSDRTVDCCSRSGWTMYTWTQERPIADWRPSARSRLQADGTMDSSVFERSEADNEKVAQTDFGAPACAVQRGHLLHRRLRGAA